MTRTPALAAALLLALPFTAQAAPSGATVHVLVREATPSSPAAERVVQRLGGHVLRQLPLVGGFSAALPTSTVATLRRSPAVQGVWNDPKVTMKSGDDDCDSDPICYDHLPPTTVWEDAIGLNAVPNKFQGDGLAVALVDTGVTPTADLGLRLLARVDLTSEHDGIDHFGHGSHMAGLIAGDGTLSAEAFEGSAPETNLVSIKVAGWDGATDVSTVIAGIQWAVSHRAQYGIRVLNLSFGTDAKGSTAADPLDYAVEKAWKAGIVVVVAAGNAGPNTDTISKPGDDPLVITVGAADIAGTAAPGDDSVAPFSSRGPTRNALAKPDVVAPGVSLVSTRAPGSTIDTFRSVARLGDAYFKGSGTSQAAAIVSGVAARIIEADSSITPNELKGVLLATANPTLKSQAGGAGMVDAFAAIAMVAPDDVRGGGGGGHSGSGSGGGGGGGHTPPPVLPVANQGARLSTGLGKLQATRGQHPVYGDLDRDRVPDLVTGEIDVLGHPWHPGAYVAEPWTPTSWAASPWNAVTAVVPGSAAAPPWHGAVLPPLSWEAKYWGASSWDDAGWTAKYWGAKYWGAKYWGTGMWQ
jgi:serine protease AprX